MIRNVDLGKYDIREWDLSMEPLETISWVWHQLMGEETAKGDTLEFSVIINGDVRLFAGVLHDKSGAFKGVIPERYSIYRDGVLDEVDHTGCTRHDNMDASNDQEEDFRVGRMEIDIEEVGRWFFENCQQSVIPIPKSENIIFRNRDNDSSEG